MLKHLRVGYIDRNNDEAKVSKQASKNTNKTGLRDSRKEHSNDRPGPFFSPFRFAKISLQMKQVKVNQSKQKQI